MNEEKFDRELMGKLRKFRDATQVAYEKSEYAPEVFPLKNDIISLIRQHLNPYPEAIWSEKEGQCFKCKQPTHWLDIDYQGYVCGWKCQWAIAEDVKALSVKPPEDRVEAVTKIIKDNTTFTKGKYSPLAGPITSDETKLLIKPEELVAQICQLFSDEPLIRKDERERILQEMEENSFDEWNGCISIVRKYNRVIYSDCWQALKEGK